MNNSVYIATSLFCAPHTERQRELDVAIQVYNRRLHSNKQLTVESFNFAEDCVPSAGTIPVHRCVTRNPVQEFKTKRRIPFVYDLFAHAQASQANVFGVMNADILLSQFVVQLLSELREDAALLQRVDINPVTADEFEAGEITGADFTCTGIDGVFFTQAWWSANEYRISRDLILGEAGWDPAYAAYARISNAKTLVARVLFHVKHTQLWSHHDTAGTHNYKIRWAIEESTNKAAKPVVVL